MGYLKEMWIDVDNYDNIRVDLTLPDTGTQYLCNMLGDLQ